MVKVIIWFTLLAIFFVLGIYFTFVDNFLFEMFFIILFFVTIFGPSIPEMFRERKRKKEEEINKKNREAKEWQEIQQDKEKYIKLYNEMKKEVIKTSETKNESLEKLYYYLTVRYLDDTHGRTYNFISDDASVKIGDIVHVPHNECEYKRAVVKSTGYYSSLNTPYPLHETKQIIRKELSHNNSTNISSHSKDYDYISYNDYDNLDDNISYNEPYYNPNDSPNMIYDETNDAYIDENILRDDDSSYYDDRN